MKGLLKVLTVDLMKDYLTDVRKDEAFNQLTDQEIIEEYMFCQLNCLIDEYGKHGFDNESFVRSCDTVLTLMFRDDSLTKRVTDELRVEYFEY